MNLPKFLLYGAIFSIALGEFGKFPFGSSVGIYISDIILALCLMFSAIWFVATKKKLLIPKIFRWVVGFYIVGFISLVISVLWFPVSAVLVSSLYLLRFIVYSNILLLVYNLKKDHLLTKELLADKFVKIGTVIVVLGFLQLVIYPDLTPLTDYGFDPHIGRLTSTFLDPNFVGGFLIICLAMLILIWKKLDLKFNIAAAFLFGLAVFLTYSRSAYLMAGIFAVGLIIIQWKRINVRQKVSIAGVLLMLLVLTAIFFPRFYRRIQGGLAVDKSASERLISWQNGWQVFINNPILGTGFNNYRLAQQQLNLLKPYTTDGGHAGSGVDSSLLLILSTTGIIGFIVYLGFWLNGFSLTLKEGKKEKYLGFILFLSLLIETQFINSLFHPAFMIWYFSYLGLISD